MAHKIPRSQIINDRALKRSPQFSRRQRGFPGMLALERPFRMSSYNPLLPQMKKEMAETLGHLPEGAHLARGSSRREPRVSFYRIMV